MKERVKYDIIMSGVRVNINTPIKPDRKDESKS